MSSQENTSFPPGNTMPSAGNSQETTGATSIAPPKTPPVSEALGQKSFGKLDYLSVAKQEQLTLAPVAREPKWGSIYQPIPFGQGMPIPKSRPHLYWLTFKRNWKMAIPHVLVVFLTYSAVSWLPIAGGNLLDAFINHGLSSALLWPGLILLLAILISAFADGAGQEVGYLFATRSAYDSCQLSAHQSIVNGRAVNAELSPGDVIRTVDEDSFTIGFFLESISQAIGAVVIAAVLAWYMLGVSMLMGLVVLISVPFFTLAKILLLKPIQKRLDVLRDTNGELTSIANDAVMGLRILRGLGGEKQYLQRYLGQSQKVCDQGIILAPWNAAAELTSIASNAVITALVLAVGSQQVFQGNLEAGQLVAFFGLTRAINLVVGRLDNMIRFIPMAQVAARRVLKLYQVPLTWENVEFMAEDVAGSPEQLGTLHDPTTDSTYPAGQFTVVVPAAEKTGEELASRLAALTPESDVTWRQGNPNESGSDSALRLSRLPLRWVRRQVLYSHGEAGLFAGTLRSAVLGPQARPTKPLPVEQAMAWDQIRTDLDESELRLPDGQKTDRDPQLLAALDHAACGDVLGSLKHGLDGQIAEKGRNLSGGQRQRVSLARALAQDAPTLLLVNPTSALDANTEARVASSLQQVRQGKTTIVVSASPVLAHLADQVVFVSEDGNSTTGTHQELWETSEAYRQVLRRIGGNA
ncbi:hypothetical protein BK816_00855 [Boudabousia tangfeifanii]|uniref:ABC transporter ATP-binding protein n=1 Tax=Boudabousia tangfeifanii TaxID=1912795 RepID=A0A1D9MIA1_9ACTO|nr:ABC transporter ATP-binding protein [Boudabousia tangfeifanii]AOZ72022.1 hypothetical protein BK816_00855 [Boudabousia tangfeifanii]